MSDDFLARWSRRKRDVAEAEQTRSSAPDGTAPEGAAADGRSLEPVEAIERARPPEPAFDLKDLPSIESITAATDIRPFLAKGVPVDIARAALRRAWSADPRIRDFVGLADYDWDYHAVGSAAGFGPLEMTDELRRAVARIVGGIADVGLPDPAMDVGAGADSPDESCALGAVTNALPTALSHGPGGHRHGALLNDAGQAATVVEPAAKASTAVQHEAREDQVHRSMTRRGHGRALPK